MQKVEEILSSVYISRPKAISSKAKFQNRNDTISAYVHNTVTRIYLSAI